MIANSVYSPISQVQGEILHVENEAFGHLPKSFLKRYEPLFHGQLISFLISGTGFFASLLASKDANLPMLQSFLTYFTLSFFILQFLYQNVSNSQKKEKLEWPIWMYFGVSILDVEANIIIISAYKYTSITSIMLLDCFSIPCVMVLSKLFIGSNYNKTHIAGVIICILGMGCIVLSDIYYNTNEKASNALLGDILCLVGTCLYACCNVLQETMVKQSSRSNYLGMIGVFGACISGTQMMILEREKIFLEVSWTYDLVLYLVGFVTCLVLMYINTSSFLKKSDAALFNLSLLTSDVYAVVFSFLVYHTLVHWLYYIAFVLSIWGTYLYHFGGSSANSSAESRLHVLPSTLGGCSLCSFCNQKNAYNENQDEEYVDIKQNIGHS